MTQADDAVGSIPENLPLIQASELAQYGFCRRAWWLDVVKNIPIEYEANLKRGQQIHARYGGEVRAAIRWQQVGYTLLGLGGIFLFIALLGLWVSG
jgi:hypothetical protein